MTWSVSMNNWSAFGCCFFTTVSYLSVTRTSAQQSPLTFTHKCILSLTCVCVCLSVSVFLSIAHLISLSKFTTQAQFQFSDQVIFFCCCCWYEVVSHVRHWTSVLLHWPTYIKQQWLIMKVKRRGQNLQVNNFLYTLILTLLKCCAFVIFIQFFICIFLNSFNLFFVLVLFQFVILVLQLFFQLDSKATFQIFLGFN